MENIALQQISATQEFSQVSTVVDYGYTDNPPSTRVYIRPADVTGPKIERIISRLQTRRTLEFASVSCDTLNSSFLAHFQRNKPQTMHPASQYFVHELPRTSYERVESILSELQRNNAQ